MCGCSFRAPRASRRVSSPLARSRSPAAEARTTTSTPASRPPRRPASPPPTAAPSSRFSPRPTRRAPSSPRPARSSARARTATRSAPSRPAGSRSTTPRSRCTSRKGPTARHKAPSVHTPTAEEGGGDLSRIDTRVPPDTMHEDDLADVLGKEPVVLTFATPALCQSRVCGPTADVAEQVKSEYGDDAAFIHMEIYNENSIDKGLRPQVRAYNLPTEPWVFVIDENGRIA